MLPAAQDDGRQYTVLVDGLEQNRAQRRETWVVWEPEKNRWPAVNPTGLSKLIVR